MRAFHAIGAALLMACAMPVMSHAAAATGAGTAASPPAASCPCPRVHRVWHARAWHRWHLHPAPAALVPAPWPAYNPPIPSPFDTAYDRVILQYTRARELDGEYLIEPPYLPNPPLPGLPHFVVAAGGAVYEYDVMADGYVQLAQGDAQRALAAAVPPPPLPH